MARNRIIYQSQSVAIDDANVSQYTVNGVQSANYGLDVAREDINQFGELGAYDRVILEAPTATAEFSSYVNGITPANLDKLIKNAVSGNNATVKISLNTSEGSDYTQASSNEVVSLTSGSLTSFSAEASVGSIATMTLGFEGVDLSYADSNTVAAPASAGCDIAVQSGIVIGLLAGDGASGVSTGDSLTYAQSCTVSFDLGTEGLQELGNSSNKFQYARVPSYPASASMSVEGLAIDKGVPLEVRNLVSSSRTTVPGGVSSAGQQAVKGYSVNVNVDMQGTKFTLTNATLDSVNFTSSLGDNATVDATFGCSIGGPNSNSNLSVSAA